MRTVTHEGGGGMSMSVGVEERSMPLTDPGMAGQERGGARGP